MNIEEELEHIRKLKLQVQDALKDAPEGSLRCEMAQGKYPQYYHMKRQDMKQFPRGRFLKKKELELARALAQKEYDNQILDVLVEKERQLKQLLKFKKGITLPEIYDKLPETRKRLVKPRVLSDKDFIKEWERRFPGGQNSYPITKGHDTERGDIVRSKTERMIADKLFFAHIPYSYEAALHLPNRGIIFPDFTILNVRTRETFYLEHLGMMGDENYCKGALEKLETYEKNGIYLGDKLLITMECSDKILNKQQVETLIRRYLL